MPSKCLFLSLIINSINPFDIDFEVYDQFMDTVDQNNWKMVIDIADGENRIWIWTNRSQVGEVLNYFKMLGSKLVTKKEVSRRNLDDDKLKDPQEERKYGEDRSLPSGVTAVIVIGAVVISSCTIVTITIILKIIIYRKNKKTVEEKLKRHNDEFNIRTEQFDINTEDIMFEQTDCAICLCGFGTELDCRVIKACQHVFHSEWIEEYYRET